MQTRPARLPENHWLRGLNMEESFPPTLLSIFRMMYWRARRNPRRIPHFAAALFCFIRDWTVLWNWRHFIFRQAPVGIALMDRLGDIISVEPVARHARERFPNAPIVWFTTAPYAAVLIGYQAVDRVMTVRCHTEWMLLWRMSSFRAVIDLHFSATFCSECGIEFFKPGAAAEITGYNHLLHGNLLSTRCVCAGLQPIAEGPQFVPDMHSRRRVDQLSLPACFVVIHCTASEITRDWNDENWKRLVDVVADRFGVDVVEIGLSPRAIRENSPRRWNLCGRLSLVETAEVIRRARLFIGIDSGPAHLANAVRTRGIMLLGHFRGLKRYMPYSGPYESGELCDHVWADGPLSSLHLDPVLAIVERRLEMSLSQSPMRNT